MAVYAVLPGDCESRLGNAKQLLHLLTAVTPAYQPYCNRQDDYNENNQPGPYAKWKAFKPLFEYTAGYANKCAPPLAFEHRLSIVWRNRQYRCIYFYRVCSHVGKILVHIEIGMRGIRLIKQPVINRRHVRRYHSTDSRHRSSILRQGDRPVQKGCMHLRQRQCIFIHCRQACCYLQRLYIQGLSHAF